MLEVLHASHAEFRSGWFVESLATQTLVVFLIRTRRVPFYRSHPSRAMLITPTAMALLGAVLPFTPVAHVLGFTALPIAFFLILVAMVLSYLGLVEFVKMRFYVHEQRRLRPATPTSHEQRLVRRIRRRAVRFVCHEVAHFR
jgi:Mg2+-importing ATPase